MSCNRCGTPKPADAGGDMGGGGFGGGGKPWLSVQDQHTWRHVVCKGLLP